MGISMADPGRRGTRCQEKKEEIRETHKGTRVFLFGEVTYLPGMVTVSYRLVYSTIPALLRYPTSITCQDCQHHVARGCIMKTETYRDA